ncbi:hypothetical protein VZ50_004930 [Salmonella enterica subsp. enterica serovar Champaign]|nr:hypothetical protein [Salmonella enterica subsp. enterica serovar Champaign]
MFSSGEQKQTCHLIKKAGQVYLYFAQKKHRNPANTEIRHKRKPIPDLKEFRNILIRRADSNVCRIPISNQYADRIDRYNQSLINKEMYAFLTDIGKGSLSDYKEGSS